MEFDGVVGLGCGVNSSIKARVEVSKKVLQEDRENNQG